MKIISICNEKGGSGKSTIAINLAIELAKKEKVLVIDADPQQSINTFISIRKEEKFNKIFDYEFKTGDDFLDYLFDLKNSSKKNYEYVISDTGGRDSKEMRYALSLSDIILVPVIPSQIDVSVFDRMVEVLKQAKEEENTNLKVFVLINNASTNPFLRKKVEELKEYIRAIDEKFIELIDFVIYGREKYKISIQMGLGVTEMNDKENKASLEIKELANFIKNIK
ncbi:MULTISPECIES: ParA family protein [Campylobacter]|uniref:ParA family protein n=1 Tax=Campylobacter TaxID=194 RepID=UPI000875206D|nr:MULTISPECIES: ParA family protein [Campylobacter]EAK0768216.1 ParA family protein [Campylobacter lari]EDP6895650.1 AAA family ATPase [Campylobacter lari]EJV5920763.1 ParA family protein [Campylobacter lari]MCV3399053.1 ParA family protein [Campylobacter lari]MCV3481804.1 ParA family protein [Campylobacter lari]